MTCCTANRHHTVYAYNHHGCRCDTARLAKARQEKRHDLRAMALGHGLRVDPTGTTRRLRALCAIGWGHRYLADELGNFPAQVQLWLAGEAQVHVDTVIRVRALYDRLADTPGPGPRAGRTVALARRRGWAPPIAWDADTIDDPAAEPYAGETVGIDPVVVERLCAGQRQTHTRAERHAAVTHMHGTGMSLRAIAERLHNSTRQVSRDLEHLGLNREDAA